MTMQHVVSNDDLGMVNRRRWEVERRMMEGTLEPGFVARNLQLTAEGVSLDSPRSQPVIISPFFASEEVESTHGYPAGHHVTPIYEQLVMLASSLSTVGVHLDTSRILFCSKEPPVLHLGAEGPFAIPKWQKVAGSYNEATELVFKALARQRQFKNWCEGKLGPKYLRLSERTQWAYQLLDHKYPGDYMIVWAQLGLNWRGRSIRKVRVNYAPHEFGLSPYEVGVILLSHPGRITSEDNLLYIDCPGGEYSPDSGGVFSSATMFRWHDTRLLFYTRNVLDPYSNYGSASGVLSQ